MLDWDDARYFLAIRRGGTLSAAARTLGVNQSTIGRRLVDIEARLGAPLFLKTRDGYVVAPAGERLEPHAERMEVEALAIEREIAGHETALTGSVRLTTTVAFGVRIVAPVICDFHERYPDIDIELEADNATRNLTKREADMAYRAGRPREVGVVARKICDIVSAPYASRAYLAKRGTPGPDFDGHDVIAFPEAYAGDDETRWIATVAKKGRIVLRTTSSLAQLEVALGGLGVALLPYYLAEEEPELVRVGDALPVTSIWLAVHADLMHAARVRACADFISEGIRAKMDSYTPSSPRARSAGRKRAGSS